MTERYSKNYWERIDSSINKNLKNPFIQDMLTEKASLELEILDFYDINLNSGFNSRKPYLILKENKNKLGGYPKNIEFLVDYIEGKEFGLNQLTYEKIRSTVHKYNKYRNKIFKRLRGIDKPNLPHLDKFEILLDLASTFDYSVDEYRKNFFDNYMNKLKKENE